MIGSYLDLYPPPTTIIRHPKQIILHPVFFYGLDGVSIGEEHTRTSREEPRFAE
jgi:hypothetical protein